MIKKAIIFIFITLIMINCKSLYSKDLNIIVKNDWYKNNDISKYSGGIMQEQKYIILHYTQGTDINKVIDIYKDYGVSCHFIIDNNANIYNILDEKYIAYHAGNSYYNGERQLNKNSFCIEVLNKDPFKKDFTRSQYKALIKLVKYLKNKYNIENKHILSHSDIAVFSGKDNGINIPRLVDLYNRKQDVSHLFNWKLLYKNGIGIWYNDSFLKKELNKTTNILYYFGDKKEEIIDMKKKLEKLGYKITINDEFDVELYMISIVFHRKFFKDYFYLSTQGFWSDLSTKVLDAIIEENNF